MMMRQLIYVIIEAKRSYGLLVLKASKPEAQQSW